MQQKNKKNAHNLSQGHFIFPVNANIFCSFGWWFAISKTIIYLFYVLNLKKKTVFSTLYKYQKYCYLPNYFKIYNYELDFTNLLSTIWNSVNKKKHTE